MIKQKFKNKKAILIASGPSLTEEVIDTLRPHKDDFVIFGCNDVYKVVDYLDVHYACDTAWWNKWGEHFKLTRPDLESWTQCQISSEKFKINYINGAYKNGLSIDSNLIHYGSNSGFQQLNLAFLMGCSSFMLLGYNMQKVNSTTHFFGEHPSELKRNSPYNKFVQSFKTIQKPVKDIIINCTENSALDFFSYKDLNEYLKNK